MDPPTESLTDDDLFNGTTVQQLVSSVQSLLMNRTDGVIVENHVIQPKLNHSEVRWEGLNDLARVHYRVTDFYAIIAQLLLGLSLNSVMLCSVLVSMRQVRANNSTHRVHFYHSAANRHVPVVGLVLAIASSIAILRLFFRSVLQIACFYGNWKELRVL